MTGQIPKYGKHFTITHREYHPTMASRRYTLKSDHQFYIQSDKTSKSWHTYGPAGEFGTPQRTLSAAMTVMLKPQSRRRTTKRQTRYHPQALTR
jgi:hypothetical protein